MKEENIILDKSFAFALRNSKALPVFEKEKSRRGFLFSNFR